ncbi:MAG: helix-turn-helix domain-containing protein [Verrucomicrobiae bacterium]|nr:helix-turn-helix domain-containing protein [Verrucomicrobiae bacterium]
MPNTPEEQVLIRIFQAESREIRTNASYRWDCHNRGEVPFVILQTTIKGEGMFDAGGRTLPVPPGHAFVAIVPEKTCYYYPPSSRIPWEFCWVVFRGELAVRLWRILRDSFGAVLPIEPDSDAGLAMRNLIRRFHSREYKDSVEMSQDAYRFYCQWWRQLSGVGGAVGDPVMAAVRYCHEHWQEPVSVKELAAHTGLSREHFTRLFVEKQGISPGVYLRGQRLENAVHLLQATGLPVKEVALRCGFYSAHQFRHAFRQRHGLSPQQYRSQIMRAVFAPAVRKPRRTAAAKGNPSSEDGCYLKG